MEPDKVITVGSDGSGTIDDSMCPKKVFAIGSDRSETIDDSMCPKKVFAVGSDRSGTIDDSIRPDKVIAIRTDANETIATGHLMRCLSIARGLIRKNAAVTFYVSDDTSASLLLDRLTDTERRNGTYSIVNLHTGWKSPDLETFALFKHLTATAADYLLIDSYFVTPSYLAALRGSCRTAYIDDIQAFDYPVDLLINYDIVTDEARYTKAGKKLLGSLYTPLRDQFANVSFRVSEQVRNILISTGGTDEYNIAGNLLKRLHAEPAFTHESCNFHVLTGSLNRHWKELRQLSEQNKTVLLHENVTNMADLMSSCDLAVSAGGTTLYELSAVGVPTVSCSMADNQLPTVHAFRNKNAIPYAGDVRDGGDFYEILCRMLAELMLDTAKRKKFSHTMRLLVDGGGVDRICEELLRK